MNHEIRVCPVRFAIYHQLGPTMMMTVVPMKTARSKALRTRHSVPKYMTGAAFFPCLAHGNVPILVLVLPVYLPMVLRLREPDNDDVWAHPRCYHQINTCLGDASAL